MLLLHKIEEFYRDLFIIGKQIPKRDRFGIYARIESLALELFELTVSAALETKINKLALINLARIKIEVLKRIVRGAHEMGTIDVKKYTDLEIQLQEISKMMNGWRNYANK